MRGALHIYPHKASKRCPMDGSSIMMPVGRSNLAMICETSLTLGSQPPLNTPAPKWQTHARSYINRSNESRLSPLFMPWWRQFRGGRACLSRLRVLAASR